MWGSWLIWQRISAYRQNVDIYHDSWMKHLSWDTVIVCHLVNISMALVFIDKMSDTCWLISEHGWLISCHLVGNAVIVESLFAYQIFTRWHIITVSHDNCSHPSDEILIYCEQFVYVNQPSDEILIYCAQFVYVNQHSQPY